MLDFIIKAHFLVDITQETSVRRLPYFLILIYLLEIRAESLLRCKSLQRRSDHHWTFCFSSTLLPLGSKCQLRESRAAGTLPLDVNKSYTFFKNKNW